MNSRVYLDWNATAPLRPEAREAMIAAMDVVGNPSSVHGEGRAAKAIVERARAQVAEAFGASGADVVFTASATEAAALFLSGKDWAGSGLEHDCVRCWTNTDIEPDHSGRVVPLEAELHRTVLHAANSETGFIQTIPGRLAFSDCVQAFGKLPVSFSWMDIEAAILSGHKIGGPKGVGALVLKTGTDVKAMVPGGGQEMGRRSGTENVIGIAGFGAAALAAQRDLDAGVWEEVAARRDALEALILDGAPEAEIAGHSSTRLPNTSCIIVPGWKGETQVMQMDLAGYAISAGSACSSGKVKASRVLRAMGYDEMTAASAIRVSIGPTTTGEELMGFATVWLDYYHKFKARAA